MGDAFDLGEFWRRHYIRCTKLGHKIHPNKAGIGETYYFWTYRSAKDWSDRLPQTMKGEVGFDQDRKQYKVKINFGSLI